MTELPKNGWYVELPENKDDIDLDKLNKALNKEYEFYHENGVDKICKYYGVISDTCLRCTDYFEYVEHLENVTHLFLKQPEYTLDNLPEKWFVEMGDDVDRELLAKKLNCESIGGLYHYYGISKYRKWSNSAECFDDCVDVTHLFKKKEESMDLTTTKSPSVASRDDYAYSHHSDHSFSFIPIMYSHFIPITFLNL